MSHTAQKNPFIANRRVLMGSLAGTTIEFYDFYIYGTAAALVFGPLFFPSSSPSLQTLSAFASFSLAFIARPLGAVVFGHFGDRIGRKSTLVASLLLMGICTFAIAFLPGYAQAGWFAPVMLCILRFGQGFGLGGEWGGAALLATENAPPGYRGRFGMFPQLGAPLGFFLSNAMFLVLGLFLSQEDFIAWGWRLPFLASAALVVVGLWVRLKITETPVFKAAMATHAPVRVPLAEVFRNHLREVIGGTFAVISVFACFYLATAFALSYGTTTLKYPRETFLAAQLGAVVFLAVGVVLGGIWADRTNARRVLMAGCFITFASGFLLAPMLGSGNLVLVWLIMSLVLFSMGVSYGPMSSWLSLLFPPHVRYTGASVPFNVGGIIGGGLTPIAATALASYGGMTLVGYYLSTAGLLSLTAVFLLPNSNNVPAKATA
jgi:MFS family permease